MSRVKLAVAVLILGAVMTASAVAIAGGGGKASARLDGLQEVPAVLSDGDGKFKAKFNRSSQTIEFVLRYEDLSTPPNRAHIHLAQKFVNGEIVADLCGDTKPACPPSPGTVTGTITQADVKPKPTQGVTTIEHLWIAMRKGITYANVHTARSPQGEIRGQIDGKGHSGGKHDDDSDDRGHRGGGDDSDSDSDD